MATKQNTPYWDYRGVEFTKRAVECHDELVAALDNAVIFLMGKARRDPQEREIVDAMRDSLAKANAA